MKYYYVSNKVATTTTVSASWKQDLQKKLTAEKLQLKQINNSGSKVEKAESGSLEKSIAEDEYSINNNIKPKSESNIWSSIAEMESNVGYGEIIALFLLISCSALVAGEFSEGTMKMIISRPYKRYEILTAKLVATLIYGFELLVSSFVVTFIVVGVLFGFTNMSAKEMFWNGSSISYMSSLLKTLIIFGLEFLRIIFYVLVAFALSAAFRSRSLATGFSLFILLVGGGIVRILAMYFAWGKYLPFGRDNFAYLVTNGSPIQGVTLLSAMVLTAIYALVFAFIGYFVFQKRDI
jgi:ABC-2 type transport system permease protein